MARSNFLTLGSFGAVSFMVVLSAIGAGCVADPAASEPGIDEASESSSAIAATSNPAGLRAGKALLAAFPSFDRKNPIAVDVDEDEADASDIEIMEATAETKATVGIDHWAVSSKGVDGFIGNVRVLAFRDNVEDPADDTASSIPSQVSLWWAFGGESGSREFGSQASTSALDAHGQAVIAVLTNDLQKGVSSAQSFSFKCVAAKAKLVLSITGAGTNCAAAVAEAGVNVVADGLCLAALVVVGGAVQGVSSACGTVPSVNVLPVGPFRFSCSSCKMDFISNTLSCSCTNSSKVSVPTSLGSPLQCHKLIRNCNGQLKCTFSC